MDYLFDIRHRKFQINLAKAVLILSAGYFLIHLLVDLGVAGVFACVLTLLIYTVVRWLK